MVFTGTDRPFGRVGSMIPRGDILDLNIFRHEKVVLKIGLFVIHNYLFYRETAGREERAHRQKRVPVCILSTTYLGSIVNVPEVRTDENIFVT